MSTQQQNDGTLSWKQNFNIAYAFALWHQRAITVPMRDKYGVQALGFPCFFAFLLMMLWYTFTRDDFMLAWIGLWILCWIKRRSEAIQLAQGGAKIHSQYDGWPRDAIRIGRTEKAAKQFVEPALTGILGMMAFKFYEYNGWPVTGLPYFLLFGMASLPFVFWVQRSAWQRRIQGTADARLEQEMILRDFQNQYRP